jgi:hypothetical protein
MAYFIPKLTFITIEITSRHKVSARPIASGCENNAIDQMREFGYIDGLELLQIAWVQAWIPGYQDFGIDDGLRPAVAILCNADEALAVFQSTSKTVFRCRIAYTKQ